MEFKKDVVIDIVCYRRRGHNEGDEPSITQPMMYQKIRKHPTTLALYSKKIIAEGALEANDYEPRLNAYRDALDEGQAVAWDYLKEPDPSLHVDWSPFLGHDWDIPSDTSFDVKQLQDLGHRMDVQPEGFVLQKQVGKILEDRRKMTAGAMAINWGYGEVMAYATLLDEGYTIRLTGQDVGRGTFSHRHAVLHDQKAGSTHTPLAELAQDGNRFNLYDSFLSEEAVLAFEYGYSGTSPNTLVIWEAQFGDFANGAQVVIDQFIASGEHKWARLSGLTMLLPHGYEGAGPEHSSARLERYLQLSAEHNIQVCVPTTPAQMFHLIRRQAIRPLRKPLIVMTPKSLLRHKEAISSLDELAAGEFETILPDTHNVDIETIDRIIFCSGKVYYDLHASRVDEGLDNVVIVRIEQLYPFPETAMHAVLSAYPNIKTTVWCQEEPMNQGAWYSSQHHLRRVIQKVFPGLYLHYAGREGSAAAAAGYMSLHVRQQEKLVHDALFKTDVD
jgi:2-oxoglutarate dehydrogenase E1 component